MEANRCWDADAWDADTWADDTWAEEGDSIPGWRGGLRGLRVPRIGRALCIALVIMMLLQGQR